MCLSSAEVRSECHVARTKLSRIEVLKKNCGADDVLGNPAFLKHLQYFIEGPQLPPDVIAEFSAAVDQHDFISGSTYSELVAIAKRAVRRHDLSSHKACEEFFKLANECGVDTTYGRMIRDQVLGMRSR